MSELMWAGSLSHNGLTGLGGVKDFAVHQLGHELSAMFDTAHGASLATVWGAWAKAVYQTKPSGLHALPEMSGESPKLMRKKPLWRA